MARSLGSAAPPRPARRPETAARDHRQAATPSLLPDPSALTSILSSTIRQGASGSASTARRIGLRPRASPRPCEPRLFARRLRRRQDHDADARCRRRPRQRVRRRLRGLQGRRSGKAARLARRTLRPAVLSRRSGRPERRSATTRARATPPAVANKLIGAFSYGPNAEIYKNIAMEAIPLIVRGLQAAGDDVTLEALYDACGPRGHGAHRDSASPRAPTTAFASDCSRSAEQDDDKLGKSGHKGLNDGSARCSKASSATSFAHDDDARLGRRARAAVRDLHRAQHAGDQRRRRADGPRDRARLETSLRATLQDARARRYADAGLWRYSTSSPRCVKRSSFPICSVRRGRRSCPSWCRRSTSLRPSTYGSPCSAPACLICHRVESEDANALAEALGTRTRTELTNQLDFETGYTQKGTTKQVAGVQRPSQRAARFQDRLCRRALHCDRSSGARSGASRLRLALEPLSTSRSLGIAHAVEDGGMPLFGRFGRLGGECHRWSGT